MLIVNIIPKHVIFCHFVLFFNDAIISWLFLSKPWSWYMAKFTFDDKKK